LEPQGNGGKNGRGLTVPGRAANSEKAVSGYADTAFEAEK
jgi:hypothetical protein